MTGRKPPPFRVAVPVETLKRLELYLGDQPQRDQRAVALHELIVKLLIAEGAL
jgi:hypothetical protein